MSLFFKYIGFIFFCFNIFAANAAEVVLQTDNPDEIYLDETIPARLDLPHPLMMREILGSQTNHTIGKLLLLGKYFDEKYPEDKIYNDFSADIALIFPELSPQEVYNRTSYIRNAVRLYRWGQKKYTEIKERILAPEPPPLLLDESDYDTGKTPAYVEAPENQFAILYDFKKVLSYGDDPRDIKAREAYKQSQLDKKTQKTGFDKFKSMVSKLEFSKLPFYGITLPNPFIGNAGSGQWVKKDNYQARLLADTAEIENLPQLLAAVHIDVPGNNFILATDLDDTHHKPHIELFDMQNIKSYQIHYPLPITVADEQLIGGYAGDFAIPLTIQTIAPDQEVSFKARIIFQGCTPQLECQKIELEPQLKIATAAHNTPSGFENFIKQSLYNIPSANSDRFTLEQFKPVLSQDGTEVREIRCVFDYAGSINNFSVFLEDKQHTIFSAPKIAVNNSKIYATILPLNNQHKLLNEEFTLSARLNAYTSLRQNMLLKEQTVSSEQKTLLQYILWGLLVGLLLNLSPLILPIYGFKVSMIKKSKNDIRLYKSTVLGIFTGYNLLAATLIAFQIYGTPFEWGTLYLSSGYLGIVFLVLLGLFQTYNDAQALFPLNPKISGFCRGIFTVIVTPLVFCSFSGNIIAALPHAAWYNLIICFDLIACGTALPYFTQIRGFSLSKNPLIALKIKQLIYTLSLYLLAITILWLLFMLVSLVTISLWKMALVLLVIWAVFGYLLNFLRALAQTKLPQKQKKIAEYVIAGIFMAITLAFSNMTAHYKLSETPPQLPSAEALRQKMRQGKNIIISLQSPNCFSCKINNLTTFNTHNLAQWEQLYNLEYIPLRLTQFTPEIQAYFARYQKYVPPLYVLYNYNLEDGLILPAIPGDTEITETLRNFDI